jgi:hypothetical protein
MGTNASNEISLFFALAVVGVVIAFFVCYMIWFELRSRAILSQWAWANEYTIVHLESKSFFTAPLFKWNRGPFTWTSNLSQAVYSVRVRDREGRMRTGWVCCGAFWSGLLSNKVKVRWEDE